ncbi:MAG: ribosome maturation factor RimP [Clostridia bacterium]|nr:ribosome maturation factor RimP [Clostridia bacterium]
MNIKPMEDIRAFFEKYAGEMGVEVVDVEWNPKTAALTVYIENEAGMDLDTCEKFHSLVFDPIDELDPTYGQAYTLNVSSPGLDRPFRTPRDFERNLGKEVEIKLYAPIRGKKYLEGFMTAYDGNSVTIKAGKEELKIERNKIVKINKAIKFDESAFRALEAAEAEGK